MSGIIGTNAGRGSGSIGPLTLDASQITTGDIALARLDNAPATDLAQLEMNQAILAFQIAAANQLAKFSMVDQVIDEFQDDSGVNAGLSSNEAAGGVTTAKYYSGNVPGSPTTVVKSYTGSNQTFVVPSGVTTINFIAWGAAGGGGSTSYGGGGGFIEGDVTVVAGETLNVKVGGGGGINHAGGSSPGGGGGGTGIYRSSTVLAIAGAGAGGENNIHGVAGGGTTGANGNLATGSIPANGGTQSAGGAAVSGGNPGSLNQGGSVPSSSSTAAGGYNGGGSGDGDNITHTAGGGGGGYYGGGSSGIGSSHGSGAGGSSLTAGTNTQGSAGTVANAGHANYASSTGNGVTGAAGQHGNAVLKYTAVTINDLTLVSNQTASTEGSGEATPTSADIVILIEDAAGSAVVNTNVKAYIGQSANATPVYTAAVSLVDEGLWGTGKRIFAARGISTSALSGTNMNYKIETLVQSGSLETRIHATSLAWA